ncbi:MAG TPA: hypothetical protein K8V44_06025 [Staphylococcus saprophyticus]|nr:hypothetical protein [Staphylococcus saprophyticus]
MKIKTKKQFTLPQLIEWLLKSGKSEYIVISNMNNTVRLEPYGVIRFSQEKFYSEETFMVEVEEEITEDTEIELLLEVRNGGTVIPYYNESITSQVGKIVKEYHTYIDGEFKLIWTHEKGLVE